ncbi:uncharacterized protein KLLA0_B07711g [Kluyveromyces lactis]|uniref:KLLA0B07711p n=1 Tax=Kluyveromyces lactis (strain ATCC 8585 / CBS 2359 / DSM 70799 / NBRC 1267 / NRRL Y-1140 / WM37) TaxID=284590 RepID=Q6CW16_KLULA|nr:uncharacterized protein KLLA0_B07711g [Kluyveromyces lactis]CAH02266.1 KLLA0B07711p [Kluyveromyces lactis]|eukprot:XP_451873.1 uncharacterized protein KLLA0_B07711g [Kluyveromyces lactis]
MVDCSSHETDMHYLFNDVLQLDSGQLPAGLSLELRSGSFSPGLEDLLEKIAASPITKFKTDMTDVSAGFDTKISSGSLSLFNDVKDKIHATGNSLSTEYTLTFPCQNFTETGNFNGASACLDPQILSFKGCSLEREETNNRRTPENLSLSGTTDTACFNSPAPSAAPLRPLRSLDILNREMFGVSRLIEPKKPRRWTKKREPRITKIARPLRKHVRFEYRAKQDETFKIVFKGGFIRQNIIRSYFPESVNGKIKVPDNWNPVTVQLDDENFYEKMLESIRKQIEPACGHVRTYWKMTKKREGSKFFITIKEEGFDTEPTFGDDQYYFNVISKVVESGSFGPIERGARNKDKIQKAIDRDDAVGNYRWCHFITSSEMKGIFDFFLQGYDYCANDSTVLEKLKAKSNPDPFKHHESRIRSHMLGYISGKSCKLHATKLSGKPKKFSEQMYQLIMSFDDYKRPYNTAKDISVMEMKYMIENLSDLLEKYYWVDPSTVPDEGYPMRS